MKVKLFFLFLVLFLRGLLRGTRDFLLVLLNIMSTLESEPRFVMVAAISSFSGFSAGFVNGVFLITASTFVSSVNGILSLIAREFFFFNNAIRGAILFAQTLTFFAAAMLAGFVLDEPLSYSSPVFACCCLGVCLGVCLCVGVFAIGTDAAKQVSVFIAAFSMG